MIDLVFVLRVIAGSAAALYAVHAIYQRVSRAAAPGLTARTSVDDLRLVLDLAARLRDQGRGDAVKLCQQLIDELLKPAGPQS